MLRAYKLDVLMLSLVLNQFKRGKDEYTNKMNYWEQHKVPPRLRRGIPQETAHVVYRYLVRALVKLEHLCRRDHERAS